MGRKRLLFSIGALLLAGTVLAGGILLFWGRRPFRDLAAEDIRSATVRLVPPDTAVELNAGEIKALAELLGDVRITRPDQSYTEYAGQAVQFTVTLADGTVTEVTAYNPFLIINGTGYRTAYGPCEALNAFANRLLAERGGT